MKFKFSLETVLRQRKIQRDEAERDFRHAQNKLYDQELKLQAMMAELSNAKNEISHVRNNGGKINAALVSLEEYTAGQSVRIENQTKVVKGLTDILDQKREVLIEATKSHKALEKLREKRYNELRESLRKKELKELDEIATIRFFRGE